VERASSVSARQRARGRRIAAIAALLFSTLAPGARAALPEGRADAFWRQDVSAAALDAQSAEVIGWLAQNGGFGTGRIQIDFSIEVLAADATTPFAAFTATADWFDPDCDKDRVPLPPGGALEGESGYACTTDGDCHLIVFEPRTQQLFEMWRANLVGSTLYGGCLAVWELADRYAPAGRGLGCSSADAAGLPMAPLLFDADEVAAGEIAHAIRFILPNARIRHRTCVAPASHATSAASGPASAPPYGARLRLRADYPLDTLPNQASRVVARALQRYGMILADGGNIALTARSDRFTAAKWADLLDPHDLGAIAIGDFEMVEAGPRLDGTVDCVRVPEPDRLAAAAATCAALLALARLRHSAA
jgi:serine/threonine-protein kinase